MGLIRRFVANPVAANMLMALILFGGLLAAFFIPRELFPEFDLDIITISVAYPGASPADVEEGICLKIEDRLTGMDGVKEITSVSREGVGAVRLELTTAANVRKVLDDVKSEVAKIDFPLDAEDPDIVEMTMRRDVIQVAIAGDAPERTRKELAEEVRDEIIDLPGVSQAGVSGVRAYEISIEISEQSLRRHKLTLAKVARAVRESSFDLPAGTVKTRGGVLSVRVVGQRYHAKDYEDIPIVSLPDGTVLVLGDMATVRESFEEVDVGGQFNGEPAALVSVFKTSDEDTITISQAVREYVARKKSQMPEGITLETWSDRSRFVRSRLDMLIRNGAQGLVLVFATLWLFLGLRLSFWVAMGIPVSIFGTILVLNVTGQTMNLMSMFALIMALGLIVDDAIVVGENVHSHVERGATPADAAVAGTKEVLLPVLGAVTTTWLAFLPLLFVAGLMGKFIEILPRAVILALAFSLLECLVILPPHLAHSLKRREKARAHAGAIRRKLQGARARIDASIRWFIQGPFASLFRLAVRFRYATVALFLAVLILIGGAVAARWIKVTVFPKVDSDTLRASLTLPTGTPFERTAQVARQLTAGALKLNEQYQTPDGKPVVRQVYSLLGQHAGPDGGAGAHVAEVIVELQPAETLGRELNSSLLTHQWRKNVQRPPDALALTFGAFRGGPGAKSIEVRLLGPTTAQLKPVAERLKAHLTGYNGVSDVTDDALPGKMEMKIRLKRGAHALGINLQTLAQQLRDAFYGNESLTLQRGRDEVKVMVRYPADQRRSIGHVEDMRIRTASGAQVPFDEVAEARMERGYTTLRRVGGKSVVTVSADVDENVGNAEDILARLSEAGGFLATLGAEQPGVKADLRGQRRQLAESLQSLYIWYPLALLGIYTVLAATFRSYTQPAIIMLAIPFGLVGAVVGHWLLGFDVTLLSVFGMVALGGIVVNDSLVLIDTVNRRVRAGDSPRAAVEAGAIRRFRPILLTTVTTVMGMGPLLFEQSFQAQFLKPMVISIAFGLSFATLLTLIAVPCLYMIGQDVARVLHIFVGDLWRAGRWATGGGLDLSEDPVGPDAAPQCGRAAESDPPEPPA